MTTLTARKKITSAMEALFAHHPFFASLASRWEIKEDSEVSKTMATDGRHLFYCPEFVDSLNIGETEWVLLHEAGHCFLGHHVRLLKVDRDEANIAFDLALNSAINGHGSPESLSDRMLFPGKGQYSNLPAGKDAEWYFQKLHVAKPQEKQPEKQDDSQESEQSESDSEQQSTEADSSESTSEQSDSDSASDSSSESEAEQGSSSDDSGSSQEQSESSDDTQSSSESSDSSQSKAEGKASSIGEVLPHPAADSPEGEAEAEAEWQESVAQAVNVARMCGNLPGHLYQTAESILGKSEIDWRTLLRRFLTKSIPQGMTYKKINRRSSWRKDLILPAKHGKGGADGLIIADVSGSIFGIIKSKVVPEIEKLLRTLPKSTVDLMQVDTRIVAENKYTQWDFPLKVNVVGGGGTDLNPAFEAAKQKRGAYKWIICITDLEWSFSSAPNPQIPTLWLIIGGNKGIPSFGERVKVP